MTEILAILGFPLFIAALVLLDGYVLSMLWSWFAAPAFHVAPLGVLSCAGLALLARTATPRSSAAGKERTWPEILTSSVLA